MDDRFLRLLMQHRQALHSFVHGLIRDAHMTEDVMQEAAVVLWKKFADFESGTNFGAWAREIAYREVLRHRRREWKAHKHLDEEVVQNILAAYRRREEGLAPADHRDALRNCLEELGGSPRDVIELRYRQGLSSSQVASQLQRTPGAVDAIAYRTKMRLADCVRRRLAAMES